MHMFKYMYVCMCTSRFISSFFIIIKYIYIYMRYKEYKVANRKRLQFGISRELSVVSSLSNNRLALSVIVCTVVLY